MKKGDRVRLSPSGIRELITRTSKPETATRLGTVVTDQKVGKPIVRVVWDGMTDKESVHETYVEKVAT